MKRIICLLAVFCLLTVTVSADVLWEPYVDDYYNDHHQTMHSVNAKYAVPDGMSANIYDEPNGKIIATMEACTIVYVGFSCEVEDEIWATGYPLYAYESEGWFRLGRLQKQYSHDEFTKDYSKDIGSGGQINTEQIAGDVYTWTYPGSGVSAGVLEQALFESSNYNDGILEYSLIYTDPNGGKWGYVGYYMGPCGWIYLDDLSNPDPAFRLNPKVENTVTDTTSEDKSQPSKQAAEATKPSYTLAFVLVGAVVTVTALGITYIKKHNKKTGS